jgi:uncharacterized protein YjdB
LVTAQGTGTATIAATSEGQTGSASVTVSAVPVASVGVTPSSANLVVGQTLQLTATPRDAAGNPLTGRVVTWSTTNASRATVTGSGLVMAVGTGSVTIRATSEGQVGSAAISVSQVPVATVTVAPGTLNLNAGQTGQLTATLRDAAGNMLTGRTIVWSTSASGVATVSGNGLVTGQGAGTATISATSEGQAGSAAVTVTVPPVASVSVSPSTLTVGVGQTGQLTATPRDAAGNALTGRVVTWSSSALGLATVSAGGVVTGVALGSVTITATSEGVQGTATVTVTTVVVPNLAFMSAWSGGTPSDGGKWTETDSPNSVSVVSTASVGGTWPSGMTNVLRIAYNSGNFSSVARENGWPLPAVGEYLFRRVGLRVDVDSFGNEARDHHPVQSMGVGASTCAYAAEYILYHTSSNYQFEIGNLNNGSTQPMYRWRLNPSLALSTYYQIEERYQRTGTSTYTIAIRVYDAAGTLRYQSSDFRDTWNNAGAPGNQTIHIQESGNGGTCLRHMNLGNQGRNYGASEYIYYGGFAVRISPNGGDWIGPFQVGQQ